MVVYHQHIIKDILNKMKMIKYYIWIIIVYIHLVIEISHYVMDNLVMKKIQILIIGN